MVKFKFFFLVSIIGCNILVAQMHGVAEYGGLELKATILGSGHYAPVEPLIISLQITNVSKQPLWLPYSWNRLAGPKSGRYVYWRWLSGPGVEKSLDHEIQGYSKVNPPQMGKEKLRFSLMAGEKKKSLLTTDWGVCRYADAGIYKGEVVLNLSEWGKGGWSGVLRIPLTFERVEVKGKDKDALMIMRQFAYSLPEEGRCLGGLIELAGEVDILEKYPASTYAGWVLAQNNPGAALGWSHGKELIDDMLKSVEERKRWGDFVLDDEGKGYPKTKCGKYFIKSAEVEAKEYIKHAVIFLEAHPDHVMAIQIQEQLSLAYMVIHEWQAAYEAGAKSLNRDWWIERQPTREKEERLKQKRILKEALDDLIKRGWAKRQL